LSEEDRRVLAVWAAACAEHVLSRFEAVAPEDSRPRDAIDAARAFARGERTIGPVRAVAATAHAAARSVGDPVAVAAARAAGHAAATAHMAAHARGAAAYATLARQLAGSDDAALDEEMRWQRDRADARVREVLGRLPPPLEGGGRLGAAIRELDARLVDRGDRPPKPRVDDV
jgi:hypothetical protein